MKKVTSSLAQLLLLLLISLPALLQAKPLPLKKTDSFLFQSSEYKVSVNFPVEYQDNISSKETESGVVFTLKVSCKVNDDLYFMSVSKHSVQLTKPLELAEISMKSFTETLKGEIKVQKIFTQNKHEGYEALIYLPENEAYAHYKVLLIDNRQYQIVVVDKNVTLSAIASDFLKSFKAL